MSVWLESAYLYSLLVLGQLTAARLDIAGRTKIGRVTPKARA